MKPLRAVQFAAGLGIAALGMVIFLKQVDVAAMTVHIKTTEPWKVVTVALLTIATLWLRALRWGLLLPDRAGVTREGFLPFVAIGFMINNFLPARIGEAVRVALLWKRNRFTVAESVGSLVVERLLDVMVYAVFLCIPIFTVPALASYNRYGILMCAGLFGVITLLVLYARWPTFIGGCASKMLNVLPVTIRQRIAKIATEVASNADWVFSAKKIVAVALLSFVTLFCQVLMFWVLGAGIKGFTIFTSLFGTAFAAIGAAIPLAPGYVGTLHAMVISGLGIAGIPADAAGALAVVYHAIGYVTVSLVGIFFYFRLGVTRAEMGGGGG